MTDKEMGEALGWASIGIGLAEIAAPKQLEKMMGISNGQNTGILRALGTREIATGMDILAHDDPTPGVWGRVVGDCLDLALLGVAATRTKKPAGLFTAFSFRKRRSASIRRTPNLSEQDIIVFSPGPPLLPLGRS